MNQHRNWNGAKFLSARNGLYAALMISAAILGSPRAGSQGSFTPIGPKKPCSDDCERWVEAVRASRLRGGLHQAALISRGRFVMSGYGCGWPDCDSLDCAAGASSKVFLGYVRSSHTELVEFGRDVITRYSVQIEIVFKGELRPGQTVDFHLEGGKYVFEDGTSAEIESPLLSPLQKNHLYVFSAMDDKLNKGLSASSCGASIFEMDADGSSVLADSPHPKGGIQEKLKLTQDQFMGRIEQLVEEAARDQ